jgi:hypothetical protein
MQVYAPGKFILHLSTPIPIGLKLFYVNKYIEVCNKYQTDILSLDQITESRMELML